MSKITPLKKRGSEEQEEEKAKRQKILTRNRAGKRKRRARNESNRLEFGIRAVLLFPVIPLIRKMPLLVKQQFNSNLMAVAKRTNQCLKF